LNIISGEVQSYWEQPYAQPYFDNSTKREVTATVGQSALLHCRVRNLGDRAVSWIRKRDLHILTVGILTYTNDQRFQSLHTEGSDEWTLRITSPQPRDSGTYECQVSTEPKISQAFRLNVVGRPLLHGTTHYMAITVFRSHSAGSPRESPDFDPGGPHCPPWLGGADMLRRVRLNINSSKPEQAPRLLLLLLLLPELS
uniref:Ig-like domain-containing protein n=1 Tax=Anopheles maculatus TaxID=74869 RepID=A0A182TAC7_9DIPT